MFDKTFRESIEDWNDTECWEMQVKETELIYLGHKLTVNDIELGKNKIKSILEMPKPEDKKDVQRLLRLINYVGKLIPNLSQLTAPLR